VVADEVTIEVACAFPERQVLRRLAVPAGTSAREAVRAAGIAAEFPGLDVEHAPLGVFGRPVPDDHPVAAGERVEVYRLLHMDPREARRRMAARGLTMSGSPPRRPDS